MSDLPHFYERIIEPINDRMIRSVWRITRDAQDAEDAMQNALLVIWKRRHRIARHAVPHALVLKICAQAACDVARRRARDRRKIEPDDPGDGVADHKLSPSEDLANRELCGEILRAINRLARSQAIAITLRVFERLAYDDYRTQVYHSYQTVENVVYRGPIVWKSQTGEFEGIAEAMKVILQREQAPDQPLRSLGFLGPERDKMKVLDQRVTKVSEQGRAWLDYRLTVKYEGSAQPVRFLFRVDTETKLPALCRIEGEADGKPATRESRFDYPDRGPADIYDLGVPRATKLVDRVPTGDLDRILKTLRAGRERMDSYRAVFVSEYEGSGRDWWRESPLIFYRKGNVFRADYPGAEIGDRGAVKRPAEGEDRRKWWLERTKSFRYYTQYILRDSTMYTSQATNVTQRDGSQHVDVVSVQETRFSAMPGETFPAEYVMRPEFVCRPLMGIGDQHQEPVLDMHPNEGPAGCILLYVGHTTKDGRVNERGVGLPDGNRYWLDPGRDYIVMRWEMVMRGENGKEDVISNHTVKETARSPQGVWYASKVRLKNVNREKNGKQFDQVYHIYVDFDVNLPDSFFEPPTPGRVH